MKRTLNLNHRSLPAEKIKLFTQELFLKDLPLQAINTLINNDQIIFKVVTWSMFPVIWAGDTVKIKPIAPEEAQIGDIILYKEWDNLYTHRLTEKHLKENKLFIGTSDERTYQKKIIGKHYSGNPAFATLRADCIMGKVMKVKKGNHYLDPDEIKMSPEKILYGNLKLTLWELQRKIRLPFNLFHKFQKEIMLWLQKNAFYRKMARQAIQNKVSIFVGDSRLENCAVTRNFGNYKALKEFYQEDIEWNSRVYNFSARINFKPVGNINLKLEKINGSKICSLSDLTVRIRFRGAGIGSLLAEKAISYCEKIQADEINLTLNHQDEISAEIFRKLGFITED